MSTVVQVRYFAGAAAAAGVDEERLVLDDRPDARPLTAAGLRATLAQRRPALGPVLVVATLLVDEVAARDGSVVVRDQACVDVLPPFAGG